MVKVAYAVAVFLFFFLLMLLYGGIAPSFWNKRIETNYYEHKKEFAELMKFLQNKTSITIDDTVHKGFRSIIMYDWEVTKAMDKDNNHISKSNLTLTPRQQGLKDSSKYFLDKINSYDLYCEKTHIGGKVATYGRNIGLMSMSHGERKNGIKIVPLKNIFEFFAFWYFPAQQKV